MDHSRQKEKWILYTFAVLLCMVLASFWLMCNIYARYTAEGSGSDEARVAKFDVTESGTLTQQIKVDVWPGFNTGTSDTTNQSNGTYQVSVTNNSEVAIEYVMTVKNVYKNLPLQFQLVEVETNENTSTSKKNLGSGAELSQSAEISADDHKEHLYQLKVSWPTTETDGSVNPQNPDYAGKVDVIEITLKAVQKD